MGFVKEGRNFLFQVNWGGKDGEERRGNHKGKGVHEIYTIYLDVSENNEQESQEERGSTDMEG